MPAPSRGRLEARSDGHRKIHRTLAWLIQSAQSLALREGNQQFTPEHLLKVLLDDEEGLAARLIGVAGGNDRSVRAAVEASLKRLPKVQGGSGQVYLAQDTARLLDNAEQIAKKAG